jgi:glycosyltransferase involved in cell wall biosynthesis
MRLAYLCADRGIPIAGNKGASVHVRSIAQALTNLGHDLQLVAQRVDGVLPLGFEPTVVEAPFDRTLKTLKKAIQSEGDGVLAGEVHGLLLNLATHEALVEVESRGPIDGLYERYSLWSLAGLQFARSRGIPFVLEVNAPLIQEQLAYRDLELEKAAAGLERVLFSEADAIFVPSAEIESYVRGRVGDRRRLYVTPNGIHPEDWVGPHPVEPSSLLRHRDRFTVVFVGSLKPWHGIEFLLQAFEGFRERVPQATLRVVGNGPLASRVAALEDKLGRDVVEFIGEVPHYRIPALVRDADVGVAPYPPLEDFYFSPMKVVEYMAAGLPVVASAIGQIRELVDDQCTGLLVPPGDISALAKALERLADSPKLRHQLGARAQRRVLSRYSWSRIGRRIEEAFSHAVERRREKSVQTIQIQARTAGRGVR